jgi:hypothetical protein
MVRGAAGDDIPGDEGGDMKALKGGRKVAPGFYWNTSEWELVAVSANDPRLPGGEDAVYRRVPTMGVLALAPMMGALFVVFLPFVGFAMVLDQGGRRLVQLVRGTAAARAVKRGSRRA